MKVFRTIGHMRSARGSLGSIGFVPTMGALHEGHLSLIRASKHENESCVLSIFVNPTQFGAGEDFDHYPRDEAADLELAQSAGADAVFIPSVQELYPHNTTRVTVNGLSRPWEGEIRPGHFDGVCTVVTILFEVIGPCTAYFGLKDLQQCAVVRRMVEDLQMPVNLRFCETVREHDGLAMSSRNRFLTPEQRRLAPRLFRVLSQCAEQIRSGASANASILNACSTLEHDGFAIDYLAITDPNEMESIEHPTQDSRLIAAARLETVRIIDNVAIFSQGDSDK